MTHPLSSAHISTFSAEISKFCYRYILHFNKQFLIFLTLFDPLKVVLINMVAILMMSAKLATLGLFKIKLFRNKGYDVITSVHDVINKILSCNSNHIVYLAI